MQRTPEKYLEYLERIASLPERQHPSFEVGDTEDSRRPVSADEAVSEFRKVMTEGRPSIVVHVKYADKNRITIECYQTSTARLCDQDTHRH